MSDDARTRAITDAAAHPRGWHALLAGGGSGGHIFPALAIAAELASRGWRVSFAGSPQGMEARLVPQRGVEFHALPARPMVGKGMVDRARGAIVLARSTFAARALVKRLGVDVVIGTGGYASAPAALGARLGRRPLALFEPNARAGAANRFLSRFAAGAAVSSTEAAHDLHCETWLTGVPVRSEFFAVHEALPGAPAPALLVLGGSQGARSMNRALPAAVAALTSRGGRIRVVHQSGERHLEETRAAYAAAGLPSEDVRVAAFLDDVAGAMAASDLVISRAGAITLAEICAAGRPSLLLPLGVAAGHQIENARALESADAARVLTPEEATAERLAALLGALLGDRDALQGMARAARTLAHPGAATAIGDRVAAVVGGRA